MKKEILTDSKVMDLFKGNERALVFYNYDTNNWGTSKYVNFDNKQKAELEQLKSSAIKLKECLMNTPIYSEKYELVAYVQTELLIHDARNCRGIIANPFYRKYPLTNDALEIFSRNWVRAGNKILSRDKETGKIIEATDCWVASNAKGIDLKEVRAALEIPSIFKNYRFSLIQSATR